MPSSLEAWIQQSLNMEAEVVRDFAPAMLTSVRKTASNCPPEENVVGSKLDLSQELQCAWHTFHERLMGAR